MALCSCKNGSRQPRVEDNGTIRCRTCHNVIKPHKHKEIYAEKECCSHCCKPLTHGGNAHGQGLYCRECYRRHTNFDGRSITWMTIDTCRACREAGTLPGFGYPENPVASGRVKR